MVMPVITCQIMNLQLGLGNNSVRASKLPEIRSFLNGLDKEKVEETEKGEKSDEEEPRVDNINRTPNYSEVTEEPKAIEKVDKFLKKSVNKDLNKPAFFDGMLDPKNQSTLQSLKARIWKGERIDFPCY